jgi:hypothetical protein
MSARDTGTAKPGTELWHLLNMNSPQYMRLEPLPLPQAVVVLRLPLSRKTTVTLSVEGEPLTFSDIRLLIAHLRLLAIGHGDTTESLATVLADVARQEETP